MLRVIILTISAILILGCSKESTCNCTAYNYNGVSTKIVNLDDGESCNEYAARTSFASCKER